MKKVIAIIMSCIMLISISPAVAAEDASVKPTVEEILSEYHQKQFTASRNDEADANTTHSRRSGSSTKTLEQETVDTLTAAGYEAYNVTAENYDTLEAVLKSDFEDMGLAKNGSYIIVISGEDDSNSTNQNSRLGNLPVYDLIDPGVGGYSSFDHTYNGKTYKMRYITVTAANNHSLGQVSSVELIEQYDSNDAFNSLNTPISILSSLGLLPYTGTIYSLFSLIIPEVDNPQYASLLYQGASNWTIKYIQIYNSNESKWKLSGGVEYVTMRQFMIGTYYDPASNAYTSTRATEELPTIHSTQYHNLTQAKNDAAFAYENNTIKLNTIEQVEFLHGERVVITHQRWSEYGGYEPV